MKISEVEGRFSVGVRFQDEIGSHQDVFSLKLY